MRKRSSARPEPGRGAAAENRTDVEEVKRPAGISRRRALAGLAAGAIAGPGAVSAMAPFDPVERCLSIFVDRGAAAALGRECARVMPDVTCARTLAGRLLEDADNHAGATLGEVRAGLSERIRRDFAEARTIQVDGWLLARTEAQLYLLAALA